MLQRLQGWATCGSCSSSSRLHSYNSCNRRNSCKHVAATTATMISRHRSYGTPWCLLLPYACTRPPYPSPQALSRPAICSGPGKHLIAPSHNSPVMHARVQRQSTRRPPVSDIPDRKNKKAYGVNARSWCIHQMHENPTGPYTAMSNDAIMVYTAKQLRIRQDDHN